jgi:hypothetical protein
VGNLYPTDLTPNFLKKLHYFAMPTMCFSEKEDANILHTLLVLAREIFGMEKQKGSKFAQNPSSSNP